MTLPSALASLALTLSAWGTATGTTSGTDTDEGSPVIAMPEEAHDYPLAQVSGLLELREGCLVLGGAVVFWPYGAAWDAENKAVSFEDSPQFEDAAAAPIGAVFTGGGGWYPTDTASFRSWRGDELADSIEKCQEATGISGDVVYAYP
ncbi:hypothetical protein NYO98_02535 [Nocardioides sp. STR2]|uniref:Uncharacterized protein n=1 Tax=Nocardioides pini TaxID=2975053 RepID=A0ABT4CAM8_9ACTN|nr:hypothetical protein [Nocardioides pini]MCY4725139.1 hypothetical protein [Nocardioides pini]